MFSKKLASSFAALSASVLLSGVTAMAQMHPGADSPTQSTNPAMSNPNNPNAPRTTDSMQPQQNSSQSAMADKDFVHKALQGGMAEVQLGALAADKGSSDDVKQFGQKMVTDHTKLGDQMKQVAQRIGVQPPDKISKKDKELMAKLQGMSGTEFDNAYIEAMVKDHKKDSDEFKMEAQQSQNPVVKQAAQQGDEVIEQHLQMIDQIAQSHNLMTSKGKLTASIH